VSKRLNIICYKYYILIYVETLPTTINTTTMEPARPPAPGHRSRPPAYRIILIFIRKYIYINIYKEIYVFILLIAIELKLLLVVKQH
jgi:hypothetical protein